MAGIYCIFAHRILDAWSTADPSTAAEKVQIEIRRKLIDRSPIPLTECCRVLNIPSSIEMTAEIIRTLIYVMEKSITVIIISTFASFAQRNKELLQTL